jgi:secondary thiamine-phosphate synthase enzyme
VLINENADPSVCADILSALERLVPEDAPYTHTEGNSDAHVKAAVIGSSRTILVSGGRLALGRWQGIFFCEFDGPREREIWVEIR